MDAPSAASQLAIARDADVDRVREALRQRVRVAHKTQREIERENGFAPRYLSQVLSGAITLSMRHVMGILRSLDTTPEAFFASLADGGFDPKQPAWSEIRQRMARYDELFERLVEQGVLTPEGPPR